MKKSTFFLLFILLFTLTSTEVFGNDRRFTYTYETSVLPPGAREIEIWSTYRKDRSYFYRRLDQRVEYEFGVAPNLMSAFYLNYSWRLQDSNGDLPGGSSAESYSISISSEWKYKLLDRVADPLGLGLYGEATLGLDELELEGKLILDKQFNNVLVALNTVAENDWETELENGIQSTESILKTEFDVGIAYFTHRQFSLGFEVRNLNKIQKRVWEYSALFAGPVLSYATENWWATLTVLPQITSFRGATNGKLVLSDLEKVEARLLFSFHL